MTKILIDVHEPHGERRRRGLHLGRHDLHATAGVSNLAYLVAGSVAPAALGLLVICWRDACSRRVDPTDDLGLCPEHREEMRAAILEELAGREPRA